MVFTHLPSNILLVAVGFGVPFFAVGGLKAVYDLLLPAMFGNVRPLEERPG